MSVFKDVQRTRVYRAQSNAFLAAGVTTELHSLEDLTAQVRDIERNPEFRAAYPDHVPVAVNVRRQRNGRFHYYRYANHSVNFIIPKCPIWVVHHEMAHAVTPSLFPDHGVEYVRNYLRIVQMSLGAHASSLLALSFDKQKVKSSHDAKSLATIRTRIRCSGIGRNERWEFGLEPDEMAEGVKAMIIVLHSGQRLIGKVFLDDNDAVTVKGTESRMGTPVDGRPISARSVEVTTHLNVKDIAYIK